MINLLVSRTVLAVFLLLSFSVHAELASCKLQYSLEGWSFFYKEYRGEGTITCNNGQRSGVSILSQGGGFTIGKSKIDHGQGVFSGVFDINEIFGAYIALDGHAGVVSSAEGQVMTKGDVSLALSGLGRGVDLGFALSVFSIRPR